MSEIKKKILIIDNSLYLTGALKSILTVTRELSNQFEFQYCIPAVSKAGEYITQQNHKVHRIDFMELSKSLRSLLYPFKLHSNSKRILQILKKEKIDIIHVNDIYNQTGCYIKKHHPAIRLIHHVRLLKESYIKLLYPFFAKQVKKYADSIICVSEAVKADIGAPLHATVIYDAMELTEALPPWQGLQDPGKASFVYLANYINGKGQQYAIEAFALLQKKYPGTTLHFVGGVNGKAGEDFKKELKQLAVEKKVHQHVVFSDRSTNVEASLKQADVALMFAESESFSMVSLEAMLYGVPLIATDCGGPAEITDNGSMAQLVNNRSIEEMATAMEKIMENPAHYRQMALKGKLFVSRKFSLQQSIQQLAALYQQ